MGKETTISWATHTFNPWIGCTKVSPGCDNCYAETLMDHRYHKVKWGAGNTRVRTKTWREPLKWDREAAKDGQPHRVFCASLADVFDNEVPDEWRRDLWDLVRATPNLTWMILTKRIGLAHKALRGAPVGRLWLGITVVNQEEADRDIPKLLRVPGVAVRWLSCEPLLGPLDLRDPPNDMGEPRYSYLDAELDSRIGWVVVGGESGSGARPMAGDWARSIRDQCERHGVPFHFKQWGPRGVAPMLDFRDHRAFPVAVNGARALRLA